MAATATGIILVAGTMTFSNEWYQTGQVNWRIPVATVLAAAVFDGFAKVSSNAATGMAVIVLIGASTTRFNGRSVADTVAELFTTPKPKKPRRKDIVV
jgi:hypothetical protein